MKIVNLKRVLNIIIILIAVLMFGLIASTIVEAIDWNFLKSVDFDIDAPNN
tara:strand:- start:190 stop:342 length:153 start_codon:yes stop_codon:yes gene_type:complete